MSALRRVSFGLLLLVLAAGPLDATDAQRVLVVHSFGSTAPPFTTFAVAFETALVSTMGHHVDLDEVSLDMARFARPELEGPFVQLLQKRLQAWPADLVVPIGSPAAGFVASYRERLFPDTPILYAGIDPRTVPPDALRRNATVVGQNTDLSGIVEGILLIAPATNHVEVVIGASPMEQYWASEFRRVAAAFADRVSFTWLDQLSFEEMLERVARLPPRSFIVFGLLLRDARGVTFNQDDALERMRAVANAPIVGLFENQLGLGIVGGRLYPTEAEGVRAASIAARILRGEPASRIPPQIITRPTPRYDWRELQRWHIPERRLPIGSIVEFRQPTVWARYRWWILGIVLVTLVEAGLIFQLTRDLLKRHRVERALRESEARVSLAADSAGAGLWSFDPRTRRVWATPRLRRLFGLPPGTRLTFDDLLAIVHPEDRAQAQQAFDRTAEPGPRVELEFRIVRADGSQRWVATRGYYEEGHSVGRWSGASLDITRRKLAEERLRDSEGRFRTIADSAPVLIWMSDVDKLCTFFNQPWLDFTGRTLEREIGDGWAEGVHADDLPGCLKDYGEAFDARRPFVLRYRLRRHDGEYRWIMDNGAPLYDAEGQFTGYIGSCTDITDGLRAEEKFRQVFEAAPNAMIMVDAAGRITLVNDQVERVFGYHRDELSGQPIEMLIPERLRQAHPAYRGEFASTPSSRPMGAGRELFGLRKDGSEVAVEVGLNPVTTSEGRFVVASIVDITGRRAAEVEVNALREELTHMSRVATMGELTAAIVHELGQPLTAILSNAQVGVRMLAAGHPDLSEVRDVLQDIVTDDQRAAHVIQHLRSLFKKGEPERRPLSLNSLVAEVVSVVKSEAERRQVAIVSDPAPRLPLVSGDRVQLQQVILNLIVNGFEAMADVTDRPRVLILRTCAVEEDRVQIDVVDNGPGIAPAVLEEIFRPFVTTKQMGMGIGLSVSDSIVRAHGGRLSAQNTADGGAAFHVVLPALPADQRS